MTEFYDDEDMTDDGVVARREKRKSLTVHPQIRGNYIVGGSFDGPVRMMFFGTAGNLSYWNTTNETPPTTDADGCEPSAEAEGS